MMKECLEQVRTQVPLVHNITNYVTVNDVANVLLACGGSPIMSDEAEDVEDITSVCGGLNINIGTLHKTSIEGMYRAGRKANELDHPVLLDPVGAGASRLRTETALGLMKELRLAAIRGNISEIKTLSAGSGLYGILMHVIATGVLVIVAGSIYRYKKTRTMALVALLCGMAAMAVVMMGANMVITPVFMGVPALAVWSLMPFIVGFNVIKAGINGAVTFVLYKRIANFLRK